MPEKAQRDDMGYFTFLKEHSKICRALHKLLAQGISRFQRQISLLFMMMSYLCEADLSAVAAIKSKYCAEIRVVLEVKGVMFFLIPGAERLCGDWQVPSS